MVLFLSDAWIEEMDRLLRSAAPPDDVPDVVIEHQIGAGTDALCYHVAVGSDSCGAASGPARAPTIIYRQSRATATAIATRTRTAHDAFMLGDLRVEGDPTRLVEAMPAMEWLGGVLAPLEAQTDFASA